MLGRLEMTIDECILTYDQLSKDIFPASIREEAAEDASFFSKIFTSAKNLVGKTKDAIGGFVDVVRTGALYDEKILVEKIKDIVERHGDAKDPDEKMFSNKRCNVYVRSILSTILTNSGVLGLLLHATPIV